MEEAANCEQKIKSGMSAACLQGCVPPAAGKGMRGAIHPSACAGRSVSRWSHREEGNTGRMGRIYLEILYRYVFGIDVKSAGLAW